jgi:large subunit ribosomal protein L25
MAGQLDVELRETRGKNNARRLRMAGSIPAVLYGHGQQIVALSVPSGPLTAMVHKGSRLVNLAGGVDESAFTREIQWDTWGTNVIHVDFTRISADEKVEVQVTIELRGEAPGAKAGGVVMHSLHSVLLDCPAMNIPDRIRVNINHLEMFDTIELDKLELPEGATIIGDTSQVIVSCIEPIAELEEEPEEGIVPGEGEPEVLGRKKEDEEEGKE